MLYAAQLDKKGVATLKRERQELIARHDRLMMSGIDQKTAADNWRLLKEAFIVKGGKT